MYYYQTAGGINNLYNTSGVQVPHTHGHQKAHIMKEHKRSMRSLLALGLLIALFAPQSSFAQQQVSMKIQPTLIEEKVDPGMTFTKTLNVANLGDTSQTLYPVARDITGIGQDGRPIYSEEKPDKEGMSLSTWIEFQDKEIVIPGGSSKLITFTIRVPQGASPGSHFGGAFLSYQAPGEIQNATGVGYEIGTVINLQISGKIIEEAAIRSFSTDKLVYGDAKVHFQTRVENAGNVFVRPIGVIEVTNMFGKKVESILVNEAGAGVLPGATRGYDSDWLPEDLQIGRYQAIVALSFGDQGGSQTISSIAEFWILPMNVVMPVLGGVLLLIVIVYVSLRIYVRRQLAAAGASRSRNRENAVGLSRLAAVIIAILIAVIVGLLVLFFYFG